MEKLEIYTWDEKQPKQGYVVCFNEDNGEARFYRIDNTGEVWESTIFDDVEYCGHVSDLQEYGHYTHWSRLGGVFNHKIDIPKE